jgi:type IX secretion system PorP/SprF family membrane protein
MNANQKNWKAMIRTKIFFALTLLTMMVGGQLMGQQDPQYSQYMFNGLAYNPAYAGSREALSGTFLLRKQWVQLAGSPLTGSLALHAPSRNDRHGFGISMVHDRLGITRQNYLYGSYAYRIPLGPGKLALGLQGGLIQFQNRYSDVITINPDQINPGVNLSAWLPTAGTGIYFSTEKFYMGLSVPNFIAGKYFRYKNTSTQELASSQKIHYFGTMGVVLPLGENVAFKPSLVAKWVPNSPLEFDFNASFLFKQRLWLGAGYRTGDAMIFMLEYFTPKGLRIGYAYDYTLTQLRTVNTGSHEIMLGFDLAPKKTKIITPRYF